MKVETIFYVIVAFCIVCQSHGPDATSMVAMSINRRCHVNALEHASNCLTSILVFYLSIANDDKIKACFTIFAFAT